MRLFNVATNENPDNRYTKKIEVPQYAPSEERPRLESLIDYDKYSKLLANINKSKVSEDEKQFLRYAAARHIVFRYSLIADYYAHASKEMQELMEQSALVILDIDDAIANGYVKLSKDIRAILEQSGEIAGEK
jgi:hypothetical protein